MSKPLTISTAISIAKPPGEVWAVLTDFSAYSAWNPYLIQVEGTAEAGAILTVHQVPRPGAQPLVQPVLLAVLHPPRHMVWEGGLPNRQQFRGEHHFTLEEEGSGTLFRHHEHFTGGMASAILGQHGQTIELNFQLFNKALKARAEGL